jgi:hypothetical protein
VSNPATQLHHRGTFIPTEFFDDVDVAECALDDQLDDILSPDAMTKPRAMPSSPAQQDNATPTG